MQQNLMSSCQSSPLAAIEEKMILTLLWWLILVVLMIPRLGSNFAFSSLQTVGVAGKAYPGHLPGLTHPLRLDVICSSGVLLLSPDPAVDPH